AASYANTRNAGTAVTLNFFQTNTDALTALLGCVVVLNVGDVDCSFDGLNATGLRSTSRLTRLDVLCNTCDAFNDYAVAVFEDLEYAASLALVFTGND